MVTMENKEIMAMNLAFYLEKSGKTQKEMAEIVGVATSTFNDWMKGKKYPRIDKIQLLADYFGIKKADLIESKRMETKNEAITDIILRLRMDEEFFQAVQRMSLLNEEEFAKTKKILDALWQEEGDLE